MEGNGRKTIANFPVVVKSPSDESMVLRIWIGDVVEDKINEFIQNYGLTKEIFTPIFTHVKNLLAQEEENPTSSSAAEKESSSSPSLPTARNLNIPYKQTAEESDRLNSNHDGMKSLQRLPSEEEDEHAYNRARRHSNSQYNMKNEDEEPWSPIQPLQPAYNEINMSSNPSVSGARLSRTPSLTGNRPRSRSLSPTSFTGGSKQNSAFQRLHADAKKIQDRKEEMRNRVLNEMELQLKSESFRKHLSQSPTRHFRFEADRDRLYRNSGLTHGDFIYNDHLHWRKAIDKKLEKARKEKELKKQEEERMILEMQKKPQILTSFAMQLPNSTVEETVNRLYNDHHFYRQNQSAREKQYRNQYNELVSHHVPSINPRSRKLAELQKQRKMRQQPYNNNSNENNREGYIPIENDQEATSSSKVSSATTTKGFFTPVSSQANQLSHYSYNNRPSEDNTTEVLTEERKFPSRLNSAQAPRFHAHTDIGDVQLTQQSQDAFEFSLRLHDLQDVSMDRHEAQPTDEDSAALNMELIAQLRAIDAESVNDGRTNTDDATQQRNDSNDQALPDSESKRPDSSASSSANNRRKSPLRINAEAPRLQATSVHTHVAHTPMHIAPVATSASSTMTAATSHQSVVGAGRLRTFSHASLGSGTHYDTKDVQDVRATSPSIFRLQDLAATTASTPANAPAAAAGSYTPRATFSTNNSVASPTYRMHRPAVAALQGDIAPSAASVASSLTAMRYAQQPSSSFHEYACHTPVLPVHERLYLATVEREQHREVLHQKYTHSELTFKPLIGRPPKTITAAGGATDPSHDGDGQHDFTMEEKQDDHPDLMALATVSPKKNVFERLFSGFQDKKKAEMQEKIDFLEKTQRIKDSKRKKEQDQLFSRLYSYAEEQDTVQESQRKQYEERWKQQMKATKLALPASERMLQRASLREIFAVLCLSVEYRRDVQQHQRQQKRTVDAEERAPPSQQTSNEHEHEDGDGDGEEEKESAKEVVDEAASPSLKPPAEESAENKQDEGEDKDKDRENLVDAEVQDCAENEQQASSPLAEQAAEDAMSVSTEPRVQPNIQVVGISRHVHDGTPTTAATETAAESVVEDATDVQRAQVEHRLHVGLADPSHLKHPELVLAMTRALQTLQEDYWRWLQQQTQKQTQQQQSDEQQPQPQPQSSSTDVPRDFHHHLHHYRQHQSHSADTDAETYLERGFTSLYISEEQFSHRVFELLRTEDAFPPSVSALLATPARRHNSLQQKSTQTHKKQQPQQQSHSAGAHAPLHDASLPSHEQYFTGKPILVAQKTTNALAHGRYRDRYEGRVSVEDSLLAYRDHYRQNIEDLRRMVELEEMKDVTFAPALISEYERERRAQRRAERRLELLQVQQELQAQIRDSDPMLHVQSVDGSQPSATQSATRPVALSELAHANVHQETADNAQQQQQQHRWISLHQQQVQQQQQQRALIQKTPSFVSSPKFRSKYRALWSEEDTNKGRSDPADTSPFRFPPEVFSKEELQVQQKQPTRSSGGLHRRRARSAGPTLR